jgi:hypothetical protein
MTATEKDKPGTTASSNLVDMSWDPITRIVGSLGIYTKIDFKAKRVAECHSTSSIFRGYSIFMKGKDPRDAHFITSRICGICGDNHATCSVYNQNMAYGVRPPHLGEWIINLGEAAEYMFDHARPTRACLNARTRPRRRTRPSTATGPSATSCARLTRSRASSTARHCKCPGTRARCSA